MTAEERVERFTKLYRESRARLLAYALRRTASSEDAADAVAETFGIAWRRFDEIPQKESSVLWLYATARRVIANQTRRTQHRSQLIQQIAATLSTQLSVQMDASEQDVLEAGIALARMTDEDRELLMLAAWEGLNSTQLAYVLGCSSTAARVRLHRARSRLNAEMKGLGAWVEQGDTPRQSLRRRSVPAPISEEA
jgi:RNA polymerase sigma-70 factor (ECF subfamily)